MTGIGNLTAMSAFSRSASSAIGSLKGQYLAEEKSQIAITEEKQKVAQLATKLEWAKMVEQMSDSSKVLVLKEPKQLRPFEKSSPKLLINIILGCIFGSLASLIALIYVELKSTKITYSMLSNNIIFDGLNKQSLIETNCYSFDPKKVLILSFVQLPSAMQTLLQNLPNVSIVFYNGTSDFLSKVSLADKIVLISKIGITDTDSYRTVKNALKNKQKEIVYDILI